MLDTTSDTIRDQISSVRALVHRRDRLVVPWCDGRTGRRWMLALLLLLSASALGLLAAARLPLALGVFSRLGIGLACGQVLWLWGPFLLAAGFGLPARPAALAALGVLGAAAALWGLGTLSWSGLRRLGAQLLRKLAAARHRPAVVVGGAAFALLAWLLHTHYLLPRADGLHSAGVTWGDLPMHLGLVARFLHARGFGPFEHPLFASGPLAYPFLPDYSVAVACALGLPLRWAFIIGALVPLAALLLLLHGLARLWMPEPDALVPALSLLLFLLAGGLGFGLIAARLFAGAAPLTLLASANATYIAPHVLKSGTIGNLLLAARTAAYGMPIGLSALLLLGHVVVSERPSRAPLALAGVLTGSLPLVHGHSFLVLCGVTLFYAVLLSPRLRACWAFCAVPIALCAAPQLVWLSHQNAPGFLRIVPGFLRPAPNAGEWLLDLVLGMGLWLALVPWAVWTAAPRARRLAAPLLLLWPLANLVTFTPAVYDNVKLLAWFDVAAAPLVASLIVSLGRTAAHGVARSARLALASLALLGCTLSGALALAHELTNDAVVITYRDLRLAEFVAAHTKPSAVIATASSHHDPVAMFSGREVLAASVYMLGTHGIDVRPRARDIVRLYAGGPMAREVIARLGVSAVLVGRTERAELPVVDEPFLARQARASYTLGDARLYMLRR